MMARLALGRRVRIGFVSTVVLISTTGLIVPGASASTSRHHLVAEALEIQTGVVQEINMVRQHYGLVVGSGTDAYQSVVATAARRNHDPIAHVRRGTVGEYGVWGSMPLRSLSYRRASHVIVRNWVYNDGWDTTNLLNLDCTSPVASGCDDHRRAILSRPPVFGAHLYIDVVVTRSHWHGTAGLSIATLLVWRLPSSIT